jgi:AcrR family transcriptional regulator
MNTRPINRFDRRKQRTREQLQRAAVELILEKGYDEVAVQDITDRADLGRGTFYVHYTDKEDLVWQMLRASYDAIIAEIETRLAHETSPRLEYRIWMIMFEHALAHRDLYRVLLSGKGSTMIEHRVCDYLVEYVIAGIEAGRFYPMFKHLPSRFVAQFIIGAELQILEGWLEAPGDVTPAQLATLFYEMLWREKPSAAVTGE